MEAFRAAFRFSHGGTSAMSGTRVFDPLRMMPAVIRPTITTERGHRLNGPRLPKSV